VTPLLEIEYEVRRSDFVWMYLRSRAGMGSFVPGAFCLLLGVLEFPNPSASTTDTVRLMTLALALLILAPAYYIWGLTRMSGINRVIGRAVHLRVDEDGITGWPLATSWEETSWARLRKSWHLRGVLGLPFGGALTRRAWIPIPDRALTPELRLKLGEVLDAHYASRGVSLMAIVETPFMPRTEAESKLVPSIVISHSGLSKRLGSPPIRMGDSWIQAPMHPLFRWDEIARIDTDPKRPNVLRLWTYAGGTHHAEINEFPATVGLKGYQLRPSEVEAIIRRQFESYGASSEADPRAESANA
jgi:hypothetical protein